MDAPDRAHWWSDLEFDNGTTEKQLSLSARHVKQLAMLVGESTSLQEAVRMAVSQGILELRNGRSSGGGPPPAVDDVPEPNNLWYPEAAERIEDGVLRRRVTFTQVQCEQLAEVAGEQLSFQEAVKRAINAALAARSAISPIR